MKLVFGIIEQITLKQVEAAKSPAQGTMFEDVNCPIISTPTGSMQIVLPAKSKLQIDIFGF